MALTYTLVENARTTWKLGGGLRCVLADITTSDVSVDYSSGFTLSAQKLGLNKILHVVDAVVRNAAGTTKGLNGVWDAVNDKLMFLEAVTATLDHQDNDTDIVDTDIIRAVVLGV